MNASHYELMSTLQDQREKLAEFVQAFEPPEYATLRTEAVDLLDETHQFLQDEIAHRDMSVAILRFWADHNNALIERLNAALVAMPQAAYEAVDGGLASMESVTLSHALRNRPLQGSWTNEQD